MRFLAGLGVDLGAQVLQIGQGLGGLFAEVQFAGVRADPGAGTGLVFAGGTFIYAGGAPTLTASGIDLFEFRTRDGGTTWFVTVLGQAYV